MQPFANQSMLFALPVLQIQHGLSTQIQLLPGFSCVGLLHALSDASQDRGLPSTCSAAPSQVPPARFTLALLSIMRGSLLSCRDMSSLALFLKYTHKELLLVLVAVQRRRWEQFQEGVKPITVQGTARAMHSLALHPSPHPAWMLLHSSHVTQTEMTSGP